MAGPPKKKLLGLKCQRVQNIILEWDWSGCFFFRWCYYYFYKYFFLYIFFYVGKITNLYWKIILYLQVDDTSRIFFFHVKSRSQYRFVFGLSLGIGDIGNFLPWIFEGWAVRDFLRLSRVPKWDLFRLGYTQVYYPETKFSNDMWNIWIGVWMMKKHGEYF